jgi:hypothetical protein
MDYFSTAKDTLNRGVDQKLSEKLMFFESYNLKLDLSMDLYKTVAEQRFNLKNDCAQVIGDLQAMLNQLIVVATLIFGVCFEAVSIGDFSPSNSLMVEHTVVISMSVFLCAYAILDSVFLSLRLSTTEARFLGGQDSHRISIGGEVVWIKSLNTKALDSVNNTVSSLQTIIFLCVLFLTWIFQLNLAKSDAWQGNAMLIGWRIVLTIFVLLVISIRIFRTYSISVLSSIFSSSTPPSSLFNVVNRLNLKSAEMICVYRNIKKEINVSYDQVKKKAPNLESKIELIKQEDRKASMEGNVAYIEEGINTFLSGIYGEDHNQNMLAMAGLTLITKGSMMKRILNKYKGVVFFSGVDNACEIKSEGPLNLKFL